MFSLEQKIGQLLIIGFLGGNPSDNFIQKIEPQIRAQKLGGVIYFRRNIESSQQLQSLSSYFQGLSSQPLFITVDMEGGKVQRLYAQNGFQNFPSAREMGAMKTKDITKISTDMALMMRDVGINLNFAPCVDLDLGSPVISGLDRSFGKVSTDVVHAAKAFIKGHKLKKVLVVIKHFPGHGSAKEDTHELMTDVTQVYQAQELEPFLKLASTADMVMTSHIFNRNWDSQMPATMSKKILQKLRNMGFDGVIVSDDICMGAIQKKFRLPGHEADNLAQGFDLGGAVVAAFQAGVDMIIFGNNAKAAIGIEGFEPDPEIGTKVISAVMTAIQEGKLSVQDIEAKWKRVQKLRGQVHH